MFLKYGGDVIVFLVGILLILGTVLKWKFLVDPPEEWAPYYSHSKLKKMFGSGFLVGFNYIVGAMLMLLSLIFFVNQISGI
jgi:hypothetical protein